MQVQFLVVLAGAILGLSYAASVMRVSNEVVEETEEAKPVNMTLYCQTNLNPCSKFIIDQVGFVYKRLSESGILNIDLIPYGNTREKKIGDKWNFTCQEGEAGLKGILTETCTINFYPQVKDHLPFFLCFEEHYDSDWQGTLKQCAKVAGFTDDKAEEIAKCVPSDLGNKLLHEMALRTKRHVWVPWILIDGVPNAKAQHDLLNVVCDSYKGTRPPACPPA